MRDESVPTAYSCGSIPRRCRKKSPKDAEGSFEGAKSFINRMRLDVSTFSGSSAVFLIDDVSCKSRLAWLGLAYHACVKDLTVQCHFGSFPASFSRCHTVRFKYTYSILFDWAEYTYYNYIKLVGWDVLRRWYHGITDCLRQRPGLYLCRSQHLGRAPRIPRSVPRNN